ncbi:GQ67_03143T0 [Komagataella phaffii]|nr:GQ67_03143T0 [Komagataella phaffii]AOA69104.1 GQ68_03127T0 [Komagataella phaffii GS115]
MCGCFIQPCFIFFCLPIQRALAPSKHIPSERKTTERSHYSLLRLNCKQYLILTPTPPSPVTQLKTTSLLHSFYHHFASFLDPIQRRIFLQLLNKFWCFSFSSFRVDIQITVFNGPRQYRVI